MKKILIDYSDSELKEILSQYEMPKFRASQIYEWLTSYVEFSEMSNIKLAEREILEQNFIAKPLIIENDYKSSDGTVKFLYRLTTTNDLIEGVLLKYKYGYTLCVSSEVGCGMGCKFCASGIDGLKRRLTPGEILAQVLAVNAYLGGNANDRKITNIVLMGSGEPLDNFDSVVKFIKLVQSPKSLNISPRKISLSTCGLVDRIYELAKLDIKLTLTISLHATDDITRKSIMKVANIYSIKDLLNSLKYYNSITNKRIIFEYILLSCNTRDEDVKNMQAISRMFDCHFNFIRYNEVPESRLKGISEEETKAFFNKVKSARISATIRRALGADLEGACGQLRRRYIKKGV